MSHITLTIENKTLPAEVLLTCWIHSSVEQLDKLGRDLARHKRNILTFKTIQNSTTDFKNVPLSHKHMPTNILLLIPRERGAEVGESVLYL